MLFIPLAFKKKMITGCPERDRLITGCVRHVYRIKELCAGNGTYDHISFGENSAPEASAERPRAQITSAREGLDPTHIASS